MDFLFFVVISVITVFIIWAIKYFTSSAVSVEIDKLKQSLMANISIKFKDSTDKQSLNITKSMNDLEVKYTDYFNKYINLISAKFSERTKEIMSETDNQYKILINLENTLNTRMTKLEKDMNTMQFSLMDLKEQNARLVLGIDRYVKLTEETLKKAYEDKIASYKLSIIKKFPIDVEKRLIKEKIEIRKAKNYLAMINGWSIGASSEK